jgi:hypothetical protein
MPTQPQPEQIQRRIQKLQKEINDTRYFIIHATCKETKQIYQQTLMEKEKELNKFLLQNPNREE